MAQQIGGKAGFGLRFDVQAGGLHVRGNGPHSLRGLLQAGADDVFQGVIKGAGLDRGEWKVLITKGFTNSDPHIPLLSGFIPEGRGFRVRFRPKHTKGCGWILLLCPPAMPEKADEVDKMKADLIRWAAMTTGDDPVDSRRSPPDSDGAVATAVELVRGLGRPKFVDFRAFVQAVANEAGPDEDPDYWKAALNAAANRGLLANGSNCYVVSSNPENLKVSDDMNNPTTANGVHKPAPAATAAPAAKDTQVDDEALGMLIGGADAMMAHLQKVQALGKQRKDLLAQISRLQAELAANAQEIRKLAGKLPVNDVAFASAALAG